MSSSGTSRRGSGAAVKSAGGKSAGGKSVVHKPTRVAVFDYGAGNLHSLVKALSSPGFDVCIEPDPMAAIAADVLVLPGVGAFAPAADAIGDARKPMRAAIAGGLPTLGICLGMQLLFDESEEGGGRGLGVIPGHVTRLDAKRLPQIGWNSVEAEDDPLFAAAPLDEAYFANSFVCRPASADVIVAWSEHEGDRYAAAVRAGNAVGVQFHPEKSSAAGVRLVRTFLTQARQAAGRAGRER
ncbi:MAG: imidazole glycerol phosphate synthase subunit HisH [Gemmatimonadaceae bacterium]|nr:imidazole glycerol phosphate synthase subunit HisH [Gemmatimonadaceae bacterium]